MTLANMALEAVDECLFGANVPIAPWRDTGARISAWVDFPCKVPPCGVSRGLDVPANPSDREFTYYTLVIDPGTYTWQAHSVGGGYYITDNKGNKAFEFTVAPDEMYGTQCCR